MAEAHRNVSDVVGCLAEEILSVRCPSAAHTYYPVEAIKRDGKEWKIVEDLKPLCSHHVRAAKAKFGDMKELIKKGGEL